jgi:hypothetical protein
MGRSSTLLLSILVFAVCVAPTIICYRPYFFRWDDADYMARSVAVSQAFWSGDRHAVEDAMVSPHPPVMTMLGVPWGPLTSWESVGKCFITLAALLSLFAALCLFLLLRIGIEPRFFIIASACVLAGFGPYQRTHYDATAFMADSLLAWIAVAATLLIPYEVATGDPSTMNSILRGVFWAVICSAGAITKVSFFYFIVLIVPALFVIRMRYRGLRSALIALTSLGVCSMPVAIYYLRFGRIALDLGEAASFGHVAPLYYIPLSQFLGDTIRQSPGLLLSTIIIALSVVYLILKRREATWNVNVLPLLIMFGYGAITLASSNRDMRFVFPAIIAPSFLVGILLSGKATLCSRRHAITAAVLVFSGLLVAGVPMFRRPDRKSIEKSEGILTAVQESHARSVSLATNSPSLNHPLLRLAIAISPSRPAIQIYSFTHHAVDGWPIEDDFRQIAESDLVVFQSQEAGLWPGWSNLRVSQYEEFTRRHSGSAPFKVFDDVTIYQVHHHRL